jgi:hypothetical protein
MTEIPKHIMTEAIFLVGEISNPAMPHRKHVDAVAAALVDAERRGAERERENRPSLRIVR